MDSPAFLFTDKTRARLRAAFERPSVDPEAFDTRIRVMKSLGFRPRWVHEWPLNIPLAALRGYFNGAPIRPEHGEAITWAAWQTVYAAQELLIQLSLDNPAMTTNPKWLAFSRRIYDCGVMLDALGDAPC